MSSHLKQADIAIRPATNSSAQVKTLDDDATSSGRKRKPTTTKRRKVNHACLYCRRSHMTCDEGRPCQRWSVPTIFFCFGGWNLLENLVRLPVSREKSLTSATTNRNPRLLRRRRHHRHLTRLLHLHRRLRQSPTPRRNPNQFYPHLSSQ
jgi:hypothetical protein